MFIRANSGGTPLSYAELLLATAATNWNHLDAKEQFNEITQEIEGKDFSFSKNFILRSCLVIITDGKTKDEIGNKDIKFNVNNFNKDNLNKIEGEEGKNWFKIKNAILNSIDILKKFGYNNDSLRNVNSFIPVVYYMYKMDVTIDQIAEKDQKNIIEYLARASINETFKGTVERKLITLKSVIQESFNEGNKSFPLAKMMKKQTTFLTITILIFQRRY